MPKVKVGGKLKHFPYTKKGKAAAKKAASEEMPMMEEKDMPRSKEMKKRKRKMQTSDGYAKM